MLGLLALKNKSLPKSFGVWLFFWCYLGPMLGTKKGFILNPLFTINKFVFAQQFLALSKPTPTVF